MKIQASNVNDPAGCTVAVMYFNTDLKKWEGFTELEVHARSFCCQVDPAYDYHMVFIDVPTSRLQKILDLLNAGKLGFGDILACQGRYGKWHRLYDGKFADEAKYIDNGYNDDDVISF